MKISILGTGMVAQTVGAKLIELGHEVTLGTRDVTKTLARNEPQPFGGPPFSAWLAQNPQAKVKPFSEAAGRAELVINATNGLASLEVLQQVGAANLEEKVLIDISNPLDFSRGMPPTLSVCNTDSLGEQIQRAYPRAKVVKTLNSVTASLMVNPGQLAGGEHAMFMSGNDVAAKAEVGDWLTRWFSWKHIIDLGDITTARGTEMYLPIWLRLWGALGTPLFNVQVVKA
jgi:predicted dinucleotide-binding enzyme